MVVRSSPRRACADQFRSHRALKMAWEVPIFLGVPLTGLLLTGGLGIVRGFADRWLPFASSGDSPHVNGTTPSHIEVGRSSRGSERASSGDLLRAENWLEHPGRLGTWFGPLAWMVFAFGAMLGVNLTLIFIEGERGFVPSMKASMTAKTLCIGLIPMALVYAKRRADDWLSCMFNFVRRDAETVTAWFAARIQNLFRVRSNVVWAVGVGLAIVIFEHYDCAFVQRSPWARVIVVGASLVMTSLAGFALAVVVKGAIVISQVGRVPIYVSSSPYGVLATGTMLVKSFAFATVVYVVAVLTMVLRSWRDPNLLILSFALCVVGLYLVAFLGPQWRIHRGMVTFKRESLLRIEAKLQQHVNAFDRNPSKNTNDLIEALRKRREEIQSLPDWPFNWKNFAGIVSLAASSVLPVILRLVVDQIFPRG